MLTVHSCLHPLHFSFKCSQKSRVNRIQKVLTLTNMMLFKLYEKHTVWSVMWSSFNKLFPITEHDVHISITRMLHDCLLYLSSQHTRPSTMIIFNYMSSFIRLQLMVCSHMLLEHYRQTVCGVWETPLTYHTCVLSLMSLFQLLRSISGKATLTVDLLRSRLLLRFCKRGINDSLCGLGQRWYIQRGDVSKWRHKHQLDWKTQQYCTSINNILFS